MVTNRCVLIRPLASGSLIGCETVRYAPSLLTRLMVQRHQCTSWPNTPPCLCTKLNSHSRRTQAQGKVLIIGLSKEHC